MPNQDNENRPALNGHPPISDWIVAHLPVRPAAALDVGCGPAELVAAWKADWPDCRMMGLDVDQIQLRKNASDRELSGIPFIRGSAHELPLASQTMDVVLMLKSLHHIAIEQMPRALAEARRVLRGTGRLVILEPVYDGSFNEVLRVFHDEARERAAALHAIQNAVDQGLFRRVHRERRGYQRSFTSFDDFQARVMNVTHTDFQLDSRKMAAARSAFLRFADSSGGAVLDGPLHLEILQPA